MPELRSDRVVELSVTELIERARALLGRPGRTMLGVTGPPGAGKSTITHALTTSLGSDVVVVPMDGFHLSNELLMEMGRRDRKGAPDTYDVAGYVALLRRIRDRDDRVYAPRFDRELEESIGSAQPVPASTPLVVTEGNYLLTQTDGWHEVRGALDEVWYVDVDIDEVCRRIVARRIGHGDSPEAALAWVTEVDARNAHVVVESRDRADLVIRVTGEPTENPAPNPEEHGKQNR